MNALDAAYALAAAAAAPWWLRRRREGWPERLGRTLVLPPSAGRRILLHAVSVGEVNALRALVPHLIGRGGEPVVSTTTDTGAARARMLFSGVCPVVRYPLDFSGAVGRFLDAVRPDAVGLVELEVWPNFIAACRQRGIPVAVINGRLSERSFRGYRRLRPLLGRTFASLAVAAVQDEAYAERFRAVGVPPERVRVTGSMKWDAATIADDAPGSASLAAEFGIDRSRPLIVAGSTGPGEEALLHAACPPGVQLLCAPRKPERFDEAAAALPECFRRSRTGSRRATDGAPAPSTPPGPGRFLLDTIGELRAAYALADVAVVGRSFFDLYGSDPIEPIALGKATVIGPAVSDFSTIVAAFEAAGGIERANREGLAGVLAGLLGSEMEGRREELAERGRVCIRDHQGATARHAEIMIGLAGSGISASEAWPGRGCRQ